MQFILLVLMNSVLLCSFMTCVSGLHTSKFVGWPHRKIYDGLMKFGGVWMTIQDTNSTHPFVQFKHMNENKMDVVQRSALSDGIFVLNSSPSTTSKHEQSPQFHIFSTSEVKLCLRDRRIVLAGDSYMKHMYIGLGDILLGNTTNHVIKGKDARDQIVAHTSEKLMAIPHINVKFLLESISYGDLPVLLRVFNESLRMLRSVDAFVVNSLVHHMGFHLTEAHDTMISGYMANMSSLFHSVREQRVPLTWATGPAYDLQKVPPEFLNVTIKRPTDELNLRTMALSARDDMRIPLLDFFTLTGSCVWSNCTADGGHRSRFVNRMKAQMLLNNLCEIV